jgi:hypothetical protein
MLVTVLNSQLLQLDDLDYRDFSLSVVPPFDGSLTISFSEGLLEITPLTPGGEYTISCKKYVDDIYDSDESATFLVPTDVENPAGQVIATTKPRPFGLLEALTFAAGKELQAVGGMPTTRVAKDLQPGETILLVRSTLGFPSSGKIRVEGLLVAYSEKVDTAFRLAEPLYAVLGVGSVVASDVKSIESRSVL